MAGDGRMQQIKRKKLYEEVIAGILDMVKTSALRQGDKIQSEKELSDLFGVSRMVVREALSALQARGFVEVRHGSGIYLKDVDLLYNMDIQFAAGKQHILNILELRKGVESEVAYLAAIRSDGKDQEKLQATLDDMFQAVSSGGNAAEEDYRFHVTLFAACHNPVYTKVFSDIITPSYYEVLRSSHQVFSQTFGPRLVIVQEHKAIFDHIAGRQPAEARKAMWQHLDSVESKLRKLFHLG
jgi:GntR family transcriptional repressor for pyruvate dehydrogenase complex